MKNNIIKYLAFAALFITVGAYAMLKNDLPEYSVCPVCKMKVELSEAYTWKYADKMYYFDSYNCKESFKMNPDKFLENKLDTVK